jgi:hypothetical protein
MTLYLYTAVVFLTGFLLLAVQLVFGKITLPLLGGAPNVWLTSLAFYQTTLMFGYMYSYLMQRFISIKKQIVIHVGLFLLSLFFIPLSLDTSLLNDFSTTHAYSLFMVLATSVGIPYFMLTATSPLTQSWFGNTLHEKSNSPYFLYVASNLGTFISLMIYPFIVEPLMAVDLQSSVWSMLYIVEIALIACCGLTFFYMYKKNINKDVKKESADIIKEEVKETIMTKQLLFKWVLFAFVPSALLSSTTTKLTIDIAPIPLFWVIPLGLYFLSFTIAFSENKKINRSFQATTIVLLILSLVNSLKYFEMNVLSSAIIWVSTLFFLSINLHKKLADSAPSKEKLTLFYLFLAIGGSLGGIFTGIICPLIFNDYYEHNLLLLLAGIVCSYGFKTDFYKKHISDDRIYKLLLLVVLPAIMFYFSYYQIKDIDTSVIYLILPIYSMFILTNVDKSFFKYSTPAIVMALSLSVLISMDVSGFLHKERTFFGVYKITEGTNAENNKVHYLIHGSTLHGAQIQSPESEVTKTLNYYSIDNGLNKAIQYYREKSKIENVAIIGLGTGAMTCLFDKTENINYFEIDKAVADIAANDDYFSYLSNCKAPYDITFGDARIKIKNVKDNKYNIIVIDAFSSDAIPTHLLTLEAIKSYQDKLVDDGIVVFHISNRYLNLEPVISNIANSINLESKVCKTGQKDLIDIHGTASNVVVIGKDLSTLKKERDNCWKSPIMNSTQHKIWTDNYSSIFPYMM